MKTLERFKNRILQILNVLHYISAKRLVNLLQLAFSYLFSIFKIGKAKKSMPFFLSVEVSNFCNLHCPECPVGIRKTLSREKKIIDISIYKKLIDELKPTLQHIILYFQGEPLLNEQLPQLIEYAHASNIYTSTSTNGQNIAKNSAKLLVVSGLDKIIISVDGTTQETYETYRIGGNLRKVLESIENILFWKNELKSITPLIEIQFLVLKTNEHQLNDMRQLANKLKVDRLTFKTAQLYDFENGNDLMPLNSEYSRYTKTRNDKYKIKGRQSNRCWRLWSGAVVNVEGDVLPCCFDKASEYSFGNISFNSFEDSWNSKKASDFREKILRNRKQFEMCRNCTS